MSKGCTECRRDGGAFEIYRFILFYGAIFRWNAVCSVVCCHTTFNTFARYAWTRCTHLSLGLCSHNQGGRAVARIIKKQQETKSVKLLFYAMSTCVYLVYVLLIVNDVCFLRRHHQYVQNIIFTFMWMSYTFSRGTLPFAYRFSAGCSNWLLQHKSSSCFDFRNRAKDGQHNLAKRLTQRTINGELR